MEICHQIEAADTARGQPVLIDQGAEPPVDCDCLSDIGGLGTDDVLGFTRERGQFFAGYGGGLDIVQEFLNIERDEIYG
jgi:hypothetical protein